MTSRLKLWFARRWLHLVPIEELFSYARDRKDFEKFNKMYQELADNIINTYFKEMK